MMLPVWIISTRAKLAENQLDSSNMVPAQWQSMYWCRHSGWQHPVAYSQRTCSRNVITQPVPSSPSTGKYVTFKSACLTLVRTKSMRRKWGDGDDAADAIVKGQEQGAVLQLDDPIFEIFLTALLLWLQQHLIATLVPSPSMNCVFSFLHMWSISIPRWFTMYRPTGFVIFVW